MTGNPPLPCTASVTTPAAQGSVSHSAAENKLREVFPSTPQQRGHQMLPCAGPPALFYLSVALGLSAFGRSCAWCCRVVCFELLFVLRGFFSLPVHEYVVTGFYWENLRLQTIVTLIGSSLFQPSVPAVLYVWHNTGTSSQPCCSWVYFIRKLKYFKLHLCNEEPTTVFASLAMLWCVVPLATVLACIPIPLQRQWCRALEARSGLLNPCLPPLNISPTFVLKTRSQLCEVCAV